MARPVAFLRRWRLAAAYGVLVVAIAAGMWRVEAVADEAHATAERVEAEAAALAVRECRLLDATRAELRGALLEDLTDALALVASASDEQAAEFRALLGPRLLERYPPIDCPGGLDR